MTRAQAYILRGHFERGDCIQLDEAVPDAPAGNVQVTVVVGPLEVTKSGPKPVLSEEGRRRLEAFERAVAMPISEEEKQFWLELGDSQSELRRQGTSGPEDI